MPSFIHSYMMMIGLNPGPRARIVKPGPRHLRTRPDPGQNRLGPHKGVLSGDSRQCTPGSTEAVISALAPTAPPPIKAAQNAITVYIYIPGAMVHASPSLCPPYPQQPYPSMSGRCSSMFHLQRSDMPSGPWYYSRQVGRQQVHVGHGYACWSAQPMLRDVACPVLCCL